MRWLQRAVLWGLLLAGLMLAWHNNKHLLNLEFGGNEGLTEARPRTVYQLKPGEAVTFTLNSDRRDIRIISNAAILPTALDDPTTGFLYKLQVTVLDDQDAQRTTRNHHHMGKIHWVQRAEDITKKQNRNFYLDQALEPTTNEDLYVFQDQLLHADRLRVRFEQIDPRVAEVAVRVFEKIDRSDEEALLQHISLILNIS